MSSEEEQILQRRTHLAELSQLGVETFPHRFERTDSVSDLVAAHSEKTGPPLDEHRVDAATSGRILSIRGFGKASFLVLSDGRSKIQIYVKKDSLPERDFKTFELLDIG